MKLAASQIQTLPDPASLLTPLLASYCLLGYSLDRRMLRMLPRTIVDGSAAHMVVASLVPPPLWLPAAMRPHSAPPGIGQPLPPGFPANQIFFPGKCATRPLLWVRVLPRAPAENNCAHPACPGSWSQLAQE